MASSNPPRAPLTPTPSPPTATNATSSPNPNTPVNTDSSSSNADSDPLANFDVNFSLVVSENFDPSTRSVSAATAPATSSPPKPCRQAQNESTETGLREILIQSESTQSSPDIGMQGKSMVSATSTTGTESEGNIFGLMASRSPSYIDAYYGSSNAPPSPSSSYCPAENLVGKPHHVETTTGALVVPSITHAPPRKDRPTHRPRFSIGSVPPSPIPIDHPTTFFSPHYTVTLDPPRDGNTSSTSSSSGLLLEYPPSPKTRTRVGQSKVAPSRASRVESFRTSTEEDDLPCIVGEFSPMKPTFGPEVHYLGEPVHHIPRGAPLHFLSNHHSPAAAPTFARPGANLTPRRVSSLSLSPIISAERLDLYPDSTPDYIDAALKAIPKTTTVTLHVDQEGLRNQSQTMGYLRIHKPVVFQELQKNTQKNAANWGETPGKPQPFQKTGCIEFGVDPRKRPKWLFHYSAKQVLPALCRVMVNEDKELDYMSRKSSLTIKMPGVYSVIGSEAGGRAEWKFTYLVQPRLTLNASEPVKGDMYIVPMAFYASPTFFNQNHATKIGLLSHLKKTVIPRHFAEMDIPPRLSSPVVSSASETGSSSSSMFTRTLGEFAGMIGFGKTPAASARPKSGVFSIESSQSSQSDATRERGRSLFSKGRQATRVPGPPSVSGTIGSWSIGKRLGRFQASDGVDSPRRTGLNPFASFRTRGRFGGGPTEPMSPTSIPINWRLNPEVGPPVQPRDGGGVTMPVSSSLPGLSGRSRGAGDVLEVDELGRVLQRHSVLSSGSGGPTREASLRQYHEKARLLHRLDEEALGAEPEKSQDPRASAPLPLPVGSYPILGRNRRRVNSNASGGW